jgi:hypothetical protein
MLEFLGLNEKQTILLTGVLLGILMLFFAIITAITGLQILGILWCN